MDNFDNHTVRFREDIVYRKWVIGAITKMDFPSWEDYKVLDNKGDE